MEKRPPLLIDLAKECRVVYERAVRDLGADLGGYSVLDLCADNVTSASLADLKSAIVVAGIYAEAGPEIRRQIASYQ